MKPLVTIGISTHNPKRLNYLKEAVASALAQTYPNIEVLISQDSGKDCLDESIRMWSQAMVNKNPKVSYRYNPHNLGVGGNWNAIAEAARGKYLVILMDDDRLLPDFVKTLIKAMTPKIQLAFSNHYLINSNGKRLEKESYELTKRYRRDRIPLGEVNSPEIWAWQNSIPLCASLIQTKEVRYLRFKEDLNTQDTEFLIHLAHEGGRFVFVPEYLSEYRLHDQSTTSTGLCTDKLVSYLLPINVDPQVEPYKRELLLDLMVNAVSRCLLHGNLEEARRLVHSKYYPSSKKNFKSLLQKSCLILPDSFCCFSYRVLHSVKTRTDALKSRSLKT